MGGAGQDRIVPVCGARLAFPSSPVESIRHPDDYRVICQAKAIKIEARQCDRYDDRRFKPFSCKPSQKGPHHDRSSPPIGSTVSELKEMQVGGLLDTALDHYPQEALIGRTHEKRSRPRICQDIVHERAHPAERLQRKHPFRTRFVVIPGRFQNAAEDKRTIADEEWLVGQQRHTVASHGNRWSTGLLGTLAVRQAGSYLVDRFLERFIV